MRAEATKCEESIEPANQPTTSECSPYLRLRDIAVKNLDRIGVNHIHDVGRGCLLANWGDLIGVLARLARYNTHAERHHHLPHLLPWGDPQDRWEQQLLVIEAPIKDDDWLQMVVDEVAESGMVEVWVVGAWPKRSAALTDQLIAQEEL